MLGRVPLEASVMIFEPHHADLQRCSKIRQVPDNQEVWMDQDGYTSIIFDITERVGPKGEGPEIDGRALTTHLEDIVGDDIDTVRVWNSSPTQFSRLEYALSQLLRLHLGPQVSKFS